jgi:hypothetical protein
MGMEVHLNGLIRCKELGNWELNFGTISMLRKNLLMSI